MVDRKARDELTVALQQLASGAMTNEEYDELYFEGWNTSTDAAVAEIAGFGWTLYDDTRRHPYKLLGSDAIPPAGQAFVERALLFLDGDREYEWTQEVFGIRPARGSALFWLWFWLLFYGLLGLALLTLLTIEKSRTPLVFDLIGLGALTVVVHLIFVWAMRRERWNRFLSAGDFDSAWPFLRKDEVPIAPANVNS